MANPVRIWLKAGDQVEVVVTYDCSMSDFQEIDVILDHEPVSKVAMPVKNRVVISEEGAQPEILSCKFRVQMNFSQVESMGNLTILRSGEQDTLLREKLPPVSLTQDPVKASSAIGIHLLVTSTRAWVSDVTVF